MIQIYVTDNCPRCHSLLSWLDANIIGYEVRMLDAEALSEMACDGIFTREAPVMRVGKFWYKSNELFTGMELDAEKMRRIFAMGASR
jgi:glutaredoxin